MSRLHRIAFGISNEEATFVRRGFRRTNAHARDRLELAGRTFLLGYHEALDDAGPSENLVRELNRVKPEFRGFAFEGAAMGLTLVDQLSLQHRGRLREFLNGAGAPHSYMVHVGSGWAFARLHRDIERSSAQSDPLLRWLVVDGYGFHEGYFRWRRYLGAHQYPRRLSNYGRRVFDQGFGRSLWFVNGAEVDEIRATIQSFPPVRHADLWSGVGLACGYAGGIDKPALEALRVAARPHVSHLAQGVAFAAKARQRADNPALQTELACAVLCGLSANQAADVTDAALESLPPDCDEEPAYEEWRRRIRTRFTEEEVVA
jgi:enediyne biosynthesis protein E3